MPHHRAHDHLIAMPDPRSRVTDSCHGLLSAADDAADREAVQQLLRCRITSMPVLFCISAEAAIDPARDRPGAAPATSRDTSASAAPARAAGGARSPRSSARTRRISSASRRSSAGARHGRDAAASSSARSCSLERGEIRSPRVGRRRRRRRAPPSAPRAAGATAGDDADPRQPVRTESPAAS